MLPVDDDSMVYYYSSYEAGFNALKECIDECSIASESESSTPSLGDEESTNLNSFVGTLSEDDDISIDTYGSLNDGDDTRGGFSPNASRSTQYTYFTLEDLSTIYEDGESQDESILTVARRPLMREDAGYSLRPMFSRIQTQRLTSPVGQEITFSDDDDCAEHSSPEWTLNDCDYKRIEHEISGSTSTGRSSDFSSDSSVESEALCFEIMQRKLGFKLARIFLEKYLHLQRSQPRQDIRRQAIELSRLQAFEYLYSLRISEAQMEELEEQRVAACALFQTAQKRLSFELNILRVRKKVFASSDSWSQRAVELSISPPGSFESPSLELRRKRLRRQLSEKKLRDAFQVFHHIVLTPPRH
jgi:hypothetical protein